MLLISELLVNVGVEGWEWERKCDWEEAVLLLNAAVREPAILIKMLFSQVYSFDDVISDQP